MMGVRMPHAAHERDEGTLLYPTEGPKHGADRLKKRTQINWNPGRVEA